LVPYSKFHNIPAKRSCSAKQHLSNSAHLIRRIVRGLSIYIYQFFIPTDLQAQCPTFATREASVVGKSTYPSIPSNTTVNAVRPKVPHRPSPNPIANAYLHRAMFIQTCVMWVYACLLSKCITRACGVNFSALFTRPETKTRASNTAPTPPNPLQHVPKNTAMLNTE
jgi:hypothetical protein